MQDTPINEATTLHVAVLWARYLADVQGDELVGAMLTEVLSLIGQRDEFVRSNLAAPPS